MTAGPKNELVNPVAQPGLESAAAKLAAALLDPKAGPIEIHEAAKELLRLQAQNDWFADGILSMSTRIERLRLVNRELLAVLRAAADDIEHWGSYAGDYFQNKHNLQRDVARVRDAIKVAEENT